VTLVSVGLLRDVINYARTRGASAEVLCAVAGLEVSGLAAPDERIAGSVSRKVWETAEELLSDPDLGLHVGEAAHPAALGIVGYVMLNCSDLGEALGKLIRFSNLLTDGVRGNLSICGRVAEIHLEIERGRINFLTETPRQPIESTLAAVATVANVLTGKPLPILEVRFQHLRPGSVAEHKRIFGAPVLFSQPKNALVFSADALALPILLANTGLLTAIESSAEQSLDQLRSGETIVEKVERTVMRRLNGEVPKLEAIAKELGKSPRTLQRELAAEDVSFREIVETARKSIALNLLKDGRTSLSEISFLLGFSEPSAFHRSFRHWFGTTPRNFAGS